MNKSNYHSLFANDIQEFIKEKQAIGYKYNKSIQLLKRFDTFVLQNYPSQSVLTKEIVLDWTHKSLYEKVGTQNGRISILRGLAQYLARLGKTTYIYPSQQNTISRYSYVPHIYSIDEMKRLFTASDNYPESSASPYKHILIPCLIRLLYGCGLRISEALNLKLENINSNEGIICIYDTKFNKERFIPMADSLNNHILEYSMKIRSYNIGNDWLFPSPHNNNHYSSSTIYKIFRELLRSAGIPHTGDGPNLHCVRHTFAVHRLRKWVLENRDLNNCLPYLSVYMGHQDLRGTQHYLRLTADMFPNLIYKLEDTLPSIIPEVDYD